MTSVADDSLDEVRDLPSNDHKLLTALSKPARIFFFISVLRNAFVIIILTIAAWLYTRHRKSKSGKYPIKILQTVPSGLKDVGRPYFGRDILSAIAPDLPVATIILLLEHIAISKCKLTFIHSSD